MNFPSKIMQSQIKDPKNRRQFVISTFFIQIYKKS